MKFISKFRSILFLAVLIFFNFSSNAQVFNISGRISSSDKYVSYAGITFINANDTTKRFHTITDSIGNYSLNILITSVHEDNPLSPKNMELDQNYPNPFSSTTKIQYKLMEQGDADLRIYDILGQEVKRFSSHGLAAGTYNVIWDGTNNFNQKVSAGIYLLLLQNGKEVETRKMVYKRNGTDAIFPGVYHKDLLKFQDDLIGNLFFVRISNTVLTKPQIADTVINDVSVCGNTVLNFIVKNKPDNIITINGNIYTHISSIRYALVKFTNINNTSQEYSVQTDTLGSYNLVIPFNNEKLTFSVSISNIDITDPQVSDTVINDIVIYGDTLLNFLIKEQIIKTFTITGNLLTKVVPVKYASVSFSEVIKGKQYSAITDTLGNYRLLITTSMDSIRLRPCITNIDNTIPKIYDPLAEEILLSGDTTLNFILEEIGPWRKIRTEISTAFYDIDFVDSLYGWVVGSYGIIMKSIDGGETWKRQSTYIIETFFTVDFVDKNNGWACSNNSVYKTTDGGENWKVSHQEELNDGRFWEIQFVDSTIGFALGGKGFLGGTGVLLKTTNAGETWYDTTPSGVGTLTDISIVSRNDIWICGFGGSICRSSDLGVTWTNKSLNTNESWFTNIHFIDNKHGWLGSDDNDPWGFFRTFDGGNTWLKAPRELLFLGLGVRSLWLTDSLNGWLSSVIGAGSYSIIHTTNGGQTWELLPESTNLYTVNSFCFINKNTGWAVAIESINKKARSVILLYKK